MFRSKQWFCNLIALIILLTGMCVDEVRADSLFVYPKTAVISSEESTGEVISEVSLETTEFLCAPNTITGSQIAAQITNARRTIKLSIVFLCAAIFSLLLSNFYAVEYVVEFPKLSVRSAVLNYIHNTDGKK